MVVKAAPSIPITGIKIRLNMTLNTAEINIILETFAGLPMPDRTEKFIFAKLIKIIPIASIFIATNPEL